MKNKIINMLCVIIILFSIWKLIDYFSTYKKVEELEKEIETTNQTHTYYSIRDEFSAMVGWIMIDDTKINYPIMQTRDNEFYLSHNYKGERLRAGSIFLDYRNDSTFQDRHSIIYGHDLRNGSMFGQLNEYANEDFAKAHPKVQLLVEDEMITLEIFSAYETTTDFYYIETNFTDDSFNHFLQEIQMKSIVDFGVSAGRHDKIVTLSTCTASPNNQERFVVHAKVVERKDVTHEEISTS